MTYTSRKRSRSNEQDVCDFAPISKRINNIHIRSNGTPLDNPEADSLKEQGINNEHRNIAINGNREVDPQNGHFSNSMHYHHVNAEHNNAEQHPSFSGHNHLANGHSSSVNANSLPNGNPQWMGVNSSVQPFEPELNERQNPNYYQVNEMLYHLHVERMRRISK